MPKGVRGVGGSRSADAAFQITRASEDSAAAVMNPPTAGRIFSLSEIFPRLSASIDSNPAVELRRSHAEFDRRRVNPHCSDLTSYRSGLKSNYSKSFSNHSGSFSYFPGLTFSLCGLTSSLCGLTFNLCGVTLNLSGVTSNLPGLTLSLCGVTSNMSGVESYAV